MLLDSTIQSSIHLVKIIHYIISFAFLVNAIWIISRTIIGLSENRIFGKLERILSFAFISNLYLQMIFGIMLFTNIGSSTDFQYISADGTVKMATKRLWPLEHFVLMFFALFIANLGLILALKAEKDKEKHKRILVYYSISILLIFFSLSTVYLF